MIKKKKKKKKKQCHAFHLQRNVQHHRRA